MNNYRPQGFSILPLVTKNLLIINGLFFLATITFENLYHLDLNRELGLYYFQSEHFRLYQFFTYMFLHSDFSHLFFNMFAFWMFGSAVENLWGEKRFLFYYLVTGLGAALMQQIVGFIRIEMLDVPMVQSLMVEITQNGRNILESGRNFIEEAGNVNLIYNVPTIGASGAVYGILLAFGMLLPNAPIFIFFIPIPIKAKWVVLGYGLIELYNGFITHQGDNVAHFAHLGGMLMGFLLIKFWQKKADNHFV